DIITLRLEPGCSRSRLFIAPDDHGLNGCAAVGVEFTMFAEEVDLVCQNAFQFRTLAQELKTTLNGRQAVVSHRCGINKGPAEIDQVIAYCFRAADTCAMNTHSLSESQYADRYLFFQAQRRCKSTAVATENASTMSFVENDDSLVLLS